jgi:putative endonuclease
MVGDHIYYVYMLASRPFGTLYTGVTNDLIARTYDHRLGAIPGFTQKYGVHHLVWFETHSDVTEAITREKRIKRWRRAWKIQLIEESNPHWTDLYPQLINAGWRADRNR